MSHVKGSRPITRGVLTLKEQLALIEIMKAKYVESKLDDVAFAMEVTTNPDTSKLFRFPINQSHIRSCREAADMPPNRPARKASHDACDAGTVLGLVARVQSLEEQVAKLAATITQLRKLT